MQKPPKKGGFFCYLMTFRKTRIDSTTPVKAYNMLFKNFAYQCLLNCKVAQNGIGTVGLDSRDGNICQIVALQEGKNI